REACISLCRALLDSGPRAVNYLTPLIRNPKVSSYARLALQEIGPAVAPLAISLLKDPDDGLRKWAMRTLITWADVHALPLIISLLSDPDADIRMEAAYALGGNEVLRGSATIPDAAVEPLVKLLKDQDPRVRQAAIFVLQGLHDPRVMAGLRLLVRGPNATDATQAAIALVHLKDPDTTKLLLSLADVTDHPARQAIVLALAYANDPRGTQALLAQLADPDPNVRVRAIETLAEMRNTDGIAPLALAVVQDKDGTVRAAAARALGAFQDGRAVDALTAAWQDADRNVRLAAAQGLGRTNDPRALALLLNATSVTADCDLALYGLGQSTAPAAVDKLLAFTKHSNSWLRQVALQGLGNSGSPCAVPALIAALKDPTERYLSLHKIAPLRIEAAGALSKLTDRRAIPALLTALSDSSPDVVSNAANALTAITGQHFGYDANAWRAWWATQGK
ncbi:MAG TPA: HEAT repeat domain-containing protein, partial [Armatimonadota bacterium]